MHLERVIWPAWRDPGPTAHWVLTLRHELTTGQGHGQFPEGANKKPRALARRGAVAALRNEYDGRGGRPRRDHLAGPLFMLRQEVALAKPAAPQCAGGKVTVADEFIIESRTVEAIKVRHAAHGHRYSFIVTEVPPNARALRLGPAQPNAKASLPSAAFATCRSRLRRARGQEVGDNRLRVQTGFQVLLAPLGTGRGKNAALKGNRVLPRRSLNPA
jgi:hypothetical protein